MSITQKYPLLGSSANPDNISVTFKGIAIGLVPVIILIAKGFDLELAETDLVSLINSITAGLASGAVVFGVVRKLYFKYKK